MLDVFARVKLLFDKDKDFRAELVGILGFLPYKIELYKIAFSHSSSQYRSPKGGKRLNNERLEFLGDAILEAVVSDLVFHHFENKREGFLTNTRSKIVQRSMLNELATEMGVDRLIRTGMRGQSHNSNIGGNAFEALIGAIYLDRGYRACKKFVEKQIMRKFVNMDDVAQKEVNFKSKILEYCQKNRINCEFKLKNTDKGEGGSPVFRSILDIEGVMVGEGKGYSKKESEQNACRDALLRMRRSQGLVNQLFEAKEARTHTEAPIFVAVPKIDEIEEDIAKMSEAKTERRRQQRQRQKERREEAVKEPVEEKVSEQPKKERSAKESPQSQPIAKQDKVKEEKNQVQSAQESQDKTENLRNSRHRKQKEKPVSEATAPVSVEPKRKHTEQAAEELGDIIPVSLKPVQKPKEEENVPEPFFPLKDVKEGNATPTRIEEKPDVTEASAQVVEPLPKKTPARSRRKSKAVTEEKVADPNDITVEETEETVSAAATEEPAKKPRRGGHRRKTAEETEEVSSATSPNAKESSKKVDAIPEVPTLPFAPQE